MQDVIVISGVDLMMEKANTNPKELYDVHIVESGSLSFLRRCGKGYLDDGTNVLVINGEYFIGQTIKVKALGHFEFGDEKYMLAELESTARGSEKLARFQTRYGLIPTKFLKPVNKNDSAFWLEDMLVFSDVVSKPVVDYLLSRPKLWQIADIRVSLYESSFNRIPMWGVDFRRAIVDVLSDTESKSLRYVPNQKYSYLPGILASMLVILRKTQERKKAELKLELWHGLEISESVSYVHGYLTETADHFTHLDGATIEFDKEDRDQILQHGISRNGGGKIKGRLKQKYFQLDSSTDVNTYIEINSAIEIIELFLPQDGLVPEYFCIDQQNIDVQNEDFTL